jgi:phosphate/sulfate permease
MILAMGDIPAKTSMVSSMITNPLPGSANIQSDVTFNITVQMSNLVAGSFTNADATYYSAPQALSGGKVVGHTHVVVQDMGKSLNPTEALDATQFAFFKGINDAGNGKGLLSATVTGGLPAGHYRVCTLASSSNHQAVLMPVAQRGTADDCTKFTVIGSGTTPNAASNNGSGGQAAAVRFAQKILPKLD